MGNLVPTILFCIAIIFSCFFVFFKHKTVKDFSFSSTFPFENNGTSSEIKLSILINLIFSICSVFFYFTIYSNSFTNNYILLASISAFIICGLFFALNLINLANLKVHFLTFSLFAALITTQSVVMGFHSINLYNIDGQNGLFIAFAVIFFIKAAMELLLVSPLFKFSFLMDVNPKDDTLKKPKFIRLAFYEWLYLFLFIINSFFLLIEEMI